MCSHIESSWHAQVKITIIPILWMSKLGLKGWITSFQFNWKQSSRKKIKIIEVCLYAVKSNCIKWVNIRNQVGNKSKNGLQGYQGCPWRANRNQNNYTSSYLICCWNWFKNTDEKQCINLIQFDLQEKKKTFAVVEHFSLIYYLAAR